MSYHIPYNKPFLVGNELKYIEAAIASGKISGNGAFTKKCQAFFEERFNFRKCLMTSSCTDALEMCALLIDIELGDEVIMPAYTFVSTANAFILRGAKVVFADSQTDHPNIDVDSLAALITEKTKAIVVVHYAGMACEMDKVKVLAQEHNLFVIEDAAHALDSHYKQHPLGGIGDLATELRRLGAKVDELEDGLRIIPQTLREAEIETYDDHRMAMSLALVGLRQPGVRIKDPGCTAKTYPRYFQDLEALTSG